MSRKERLLQFAKNLKKLGKADAEFKGSAVTSMREDEEIVAVGRERVKIARSLEKLVKTLWQEGA